MEYIGFLTSKIRRAFDTLTCVETLQDCVSRLYRTVCQWMQQLLTFFQHRTLRMGVGGRDGGESGREAILWTRVLWNTLGDVLI